MNCHLKPNPNSDCTALPSAEESPKVLVEALLIVKWGGVLTHAGRQQAEDLGRVFRMVMCVMIYI